jgi:DMSO/TMAO reductase YedYZ molybdopterin-dependent catalytic subunit
LDDHRRLIRLIERRGILRGALSMGTLAMLTGCDVTSQPAVDKALRLVSSWNDRVQAALFDPNRLAPTYPKSMILKPPKFNAYYDITEVKPVDARSWKLELAGLISDKRP